MTTPAVHVVRWGREQRKRIDRQSFITCCTCNTRFYGRHREPQWRSHVLVHIDEATRHRVAYVDRYNEKPARIEATDEWRKWVSDEPLSPEAIRVGQEVASRLGLLTEEAEQ